MSMDSINKWLTLAANLGVIAGILLLAIELNQNNKLLSSAAEYNYMQARISPRERIAYDPEFAEFRMKSDYSTDLEKYRIKAVLQMNLLSLEYEYKQMLAGNLGDHDSLREKWRNDFRNMYTNQDLSNYALFNEIWSSFRASLTPEFVAFWENEIIGPE